MKKSKIDKKERTEIKKKNIADSMLGQGLFIFKNKGQATLQLPKMSFDGKRWIEPGQTWKGDSFFLKMIPREAALVKTLINPNDQKESKMEEKLLLDQPEQVTSEGQIEHVVANTEESLTEGTKNKKKRSKKQSQSLLTEDPVAGVTIIRD